MNSSSGERSAQEVFAQVLQVLEPYANDIVVIGGWVHALYLANAVAKDKQDGSPIFTEDIDITVPRQLLRRGRQPLIDLVERIGFERDSISDIEGAPLMLRRIIGHNTVIDLDILTDSANPRDVVSIEGQEGLQIAGYPGQVILLENTEWMTVGMELHASLHTPVQIQVPTLPAYVFHKGLSSVQRDNENKSAKDLVYLTEILRHPVLGPIARDGVRDIAARYPNYYEQWHHYLNSVLHNRRLLKQIADQLLLSGQAVGTDEDVVMAVTRRLRRIALDAAEEND